MIGAVILAAGESKRMGKQKLLLFFDGKTMLEHVIDSFRGVVERILVVLGHEPQEIIPLLEKLGVQWVINEDFSLGMAASFKCGLREMLDCDAIFLALGDQPFVGKKFLIRAIEEWRKGAKIVSPVFIKKKGHPVLFDQSLFNEILAPETLTIRDVIHNHLKEIVLLEAGKWAVVDVDTPEDFLKLKKELLSDTLQP